MVKCNYCNKEIEEKPYECELCGKIYCSDHYLPIQHECDEIPTWEKNHLKSSGIVEDWNIKISGNHDNELDKSKKPDKKRSKKKNITKKATVFLIILILITGFGIAFSQQIASNINPPSIFKGESVNHQVKLNPMVEPVANDSNQIQKPLENLNYYYNVSKEVMLSNYDIPKKKNIEGLYSLLNQIVLREYQKPSIFTCSESSAILEWMLEGAGFKTQIAVNHELTESHKNNQTLHSWIIITLENGKKVAVETTYLTKNNYHPPGIIEGPNKEYRKYSTKWRMYQNWKENNFKISYEEFLDKFHVDSIVWNSNYYSPKESKETPMEYIKGDKSNNITYFVSRDNFDWWNSDPYNQSQNEYSKWQ